MHLKSNPAHTSIAVARESIRQLAKKHGITVAELPPIDVRPTRKRKRR